MIQKELLGQYLKIKLDALFRIYASFEQDHIKNKTSLANSGLPEKEILKVHHHLEYIEANLFRQAMLVMICSYLEDAMNLIGGEELQEYLKYLKKTKNRKTRESQFDKRKRFFEDAGVSFKKNEEECEQINELRLIRNCIVHAGGKADYKKVQEAVEKLKERSKEKNEILVDIMADDFLYLGDDIIATATIASEDIIEHCSSFTLKQS